MLKRWTGLLLCGLLIQACSSTDEGTEGSAGNGGQAGSGGAAGSQAGSSQAGAGQSGSSGQAGSAQAGGGQAGSSQAGAGQAGEAGSAGAAGEGQGGSPAGAGGAAGGGQAGSSAAGGGQAGAGGGGELPAYEPSAELAKLLAGLEQLKKGEPADLDGDGHPEAQRTLNDDGSFSTQIDRENDGTFEYSLQSDGKGLTTILIDADNDGFAEQQIELTTTADKQQKVLVRDTNFDGTHDRRYTWITTAAKPAEQQYTEEADDDGDGTFQQVSTATLTTTKNEGGACEGMDNFPEGGQTYQPFPGSISIRAGSGAGECGLGDLGKVAKAVDCALSRGGLCLANTNTRNAQNLNAALNGDNVMPLEIGCGNGCAGTLASTRSWGRPWFTSSKMNINIGEWNKLDDAGRCNIMLHELLHWAGNEGTADHNSKEGAGDDDVYSCGRYCGQCSDAGHGSPGNSAVDCAKCADTPGRKQECGLKKEFKEVPCDGNLGGICHKGLACIAGDCQTCGGYDLQTCDGGSLGTEPTCCQKCPTGCDASNDVPCQSGTQSEDSCTDKNPPFCPK